MVLRRCVPTFLKSETYLEIVLALERIPCALFFYEEATLSEIS
jgi:hypothetical protein